MTTETSNQFSEMAKMAEIERWLEEFTNQMRLRLRKKLTLDGLKGFADPALLDGALVALSNCAHRVANDRDQTVDCANWALIVHVRTIRKKELAQQLVDAEKLASKPRFTEEEKSEDAARS